APGPCRAPRGRGRAPTRTHPQDRTPRRLPLPVDRAERLLTARPTRPVLHPPDRPPGHLGASAGRPSRRARPVPLRPGVADAPAEPVQGVLPLEVARPLTSPA